MKTPLSRAYGLGSSKEGTGHWWMQRLTSVALVPLTLWFGLSLASLGELSREAVAAWMREPLTAVLLIALLVAGWYHAALGLRVIIEDYVHAAPVKIGAIILVELGSFLFALAGIVATMRVFL